MKMRLKGISPTVGRGRRSGLQHHVQTAQEPGTALGNVVTQRLVSGCYTCT